jgi:RNA-directed DNA polymerase
MAEMPERPFYAGDGIAGRDGHERQTTAAGDENTGTRKDVVASVTMEEVLRTENVDKALRKVKSNKGSPGIDGMTVYELWEFLMSETWRQTKRALLEGRYKPQAVLGVETSKPNGGKRQLGIPTVVDRLIQQAILQAIQPYIDPTFSEHSYGFRPGRRAHDAVLLMKDYVDAGYEWIVDCDLAKFFDEVQHDVLMARVARRIQDKRILRTIRSYLQAGLMLGGLMSRRLKGTPQGGPLSPLLSNILLDDLDRELERRGHRFARYADDFIVCVKSQKAGERVLGSLERFLAKRLRLKVNQDKSKVARADECTFLGYSMIYLKDGSKRLTIPRRTLQRLREKVRKAIARRGRGQSIEHTIQLLAPILRGWFNYYALAETAWSYNAVDRYVRRRLRWLYWRHWKTPRTRMKRLIALGLRPRQAKVTAYATCGPWRCSRTPGMHQALPNRHFDKLGLFNLLQAHQERAHASATV